MENITTTEENSLPLPADAVALLEEIKDTIKKQTSSEEGFSEIRKSIEQFVEPKGYIQIGVDNQYQDTAYQDRYQDTAYDDHYKDTATYRDGTRNSR
jgi:hypothetical protein